MLCVWGAKKNLNSPLVDRGSVKNVRKRFTHNFFSGVHVYVLYVKTVREHLTHTIDPRRESEFEFEFEFEFILGRNIISMILYR